jgi:hypothetical protein
MIANNITNTTAVPDFGEYIYQEGLDFSKTRSDEYNQVRKIP